MNRFLFIMFISLLGCRENTYDSETNQPTSITPSRPCLTSLSLKQNVLIKGDINSYKELQFNYFNCEVREELLLYSLIMANKYNYTGAFYDVYLCLTYNFRYESVDLDEATSQLAIHYLFLAAERGDHQAIFEIKENKLKNSAPYALQIKKMFERNR